MGDKKPPHIDYLEILKEQFNALQVRGNFSQIMEAQEFSENFPLKNLEIHSKHAEVCKISSKRNFTKNPEKI